MATVPYHAALDTPLLTIGGEAWCIRDAAEATAIWGAPGSGKTSGSGRAIAHAFLAAGMGGLVLCAKPDEADTWRGYAKAHGREDDLVVIDASGKERFNILDYAAATLGGRGFEQNLVFLMQTMMEATRMSAAGGGDGENRYFVDGALKWLSHALPMLLVVEGTLRMSDLNRFLASIPRSREEMLSAEWKAESYCSQVHVRLAELAKAQPKDDDGEDSHAMQVINEHGDFFLTEVPNLDNRPRSSIESTLTNMLYPFLAGKLAQLFCTTTTVSPSVCRDGRIVVMDLPVLRYGPTGAVAQAMFKYLFGVAVQHERVDADTRPVFLYADEAQFFMGSTDAELLSTARSSKTCIVYITQDLPTYYDRLGAGPTARDKAESILSKFGTRIFHANTSRETNNYASEIIGKVQKVTVNKTISRGRTAGGGGNHHDAGGGYQGQDSANSSSSQTSSSYLDHELPPDHFATKLRTGSERHGFKVDGVLIRNARTWKRTQRHWIQAEFSQR